MSDVNWALGLQNGNAGDAFTRAFQQGQVNNRQNMARSAMAALVKDPNNANALAALAKVDPETALEFRKQQLEYHKAQLAEHSDSIVKGAQILRQFQPKDQASYSQALAAAQQAGIDISQVPQQYNPEYVQGVIHIADALKPDASANEKYIPLQPGGSVARINPQTGQVEMVVQANPGNATPGTPVGNVPQVHDQSTYDAVPPGGQYLGPDGHIRVKQGGQTGSAPSGGF
jgi:hypothetical protein